MKLARRSVRALCASWHALYVSRSICLRKCGQRAGVLRFAEKGRTAARLHRHGLPRRKEDIAQEIIANAGQRPVVGTRASCPVCEEELDMLEYSVDVLKAPEPIASMHELDVKRYGVIVQRRLSQRAVIAGSGWGGYGAGSRCASPKRRRASRKRQKGSRLRASRW